MPSPRLVLTAAAALTATALLLTGCSAGAAAPSAQTTKQACKLLQTGLESSTADLSSAFSDIQSDPAGAEKSLAAFSTKLESVTAKVTNPKVKAAAVKTSKAVESMDADLKKYVADPSDTAGLQTSATKVQTTFTALGTLCTA